MINIVKISHQI